MIFLIIASLITAALTWIFRKWLIAKLLIPWVSTTWGAIIVVVALVVLIANFGYWLRGMIKNGYKR